MTNIIANDGNGRVRHILEPAHVVVGAVVLALIVVGGARLRGYDERRTRLESERQSAALAEEIIRRAPQYVFVKDLDGRYVLANESFAALVGKDVSEILGKRARDLIENPAVAFDIVAEDQRVLEEDEAVVMFSAGTAGGSVELIKRPFEVDGRRLILAYGSDVSKKEPELAAYDTGPRSVQQTQRLESLGLVAGEIAHDFNNLLMALQGHVELAIDELPEAGVARSHLSKALTVISQSTDLTSQLLAYSGRGGRPPEGLDLSQLIDEMASLFEVSVSKKARLHYDLERERALVVGDAAQLRQVVMNLVGNASQALEQRPGDIRVKTYVRPMTAADLDRDNLLRWGSPGEYTCLEVADSGRGMDAATAARMFEPFFTTKERGHGLGLAAVRGIVKGHAGFIGIDSRPGLGTTLTVGLPRTKSISTTQPAVSGASAAVRFAGNVLLADDERAVRLVARRMLERLGFSVVEAFDGRAAVTTYVDNPKAFDLVLLDMTMPELSGREAYEAIRAADAEQKVLFMSGYASRPETAASDDDYVEYLQKPFGRRDLAFALERLTLPHARSA